MKATTLGIAADFSRIPSDAGMLEKEALMRNTMPDRDPMELIKVCGPTEAEMIAEMLKNNGIECTLQGESSAKALPATSDLDEVRIWVQPQDAAQASTLVEAFFTPVSKDELEDAEPGLGTDDPDEEAGFTV
jgi:hypothetical protein